MNLSLTRDEAVLVAWACRERANKRAELALDSEIKWNTDAHMVEAEMLYQIAKTIQDHLNEDPS